MSEGANERVVVKKLPEMGKCGFSSLFPQKLELFSFGHGDLNIFALYQILSKNVQQTKNVTCSLLCFLPLIFQWPSALIRILYA